MNLFFYSFTLFALSRRLKTVSLSRFKDQGTGDAAGSLNEGRAFKPEETDAQVKGLDDGVSQSLSRESEPVIRPKSQESGDFITFLGKRGFFPRNPAILVASREHHESRDEGQQLDIQSEHRLISP